MKFLITTKKLLGIVVLGLLLSVNVYAKTINIEDKISLNVPENFSYIKLEVDEVADYYEELFSSLGDDTNFYYISCCLIKSSICLIIISGDCIVG